MMTDAARFVSLLTHDTLALILAGGRGSRLGVLTDWRTKPAVPFGGKFRIIDFSLSNCLNSGIRRICVLTQYKSHALIQHILQGWNHLNVEHGEFIDIVPAQQWVDEESWYQGTADAVYQTLDIVESYTPKYVLILAGDHVYNMDYGELLAAHVEGQADFTIACHTVPRAQASSFGIIQIDDSDRIVDFEEKPADPKAIPGRPDMSLVSMGIYVFSMDYLRTHLDRDAADTTSSHDFGKDVIPYAIGRGDDVRAYRFGNPARGSASYWRDVGTVDAFYEANLEFLSPRPPLDIYDPSWPVMTYQPQLPPAQFIGGETHCQVDNSMVSGGCMIQRSNLDTTLLFSNVKVQDGCSLQGVLALPGCEIGAGSRLRNVILDNECRISEGSVIGEDPQDDSRRFDMTESGLVVVNRKMLGQGRQYRPGTTREPHCAPRLPGRPDPLP
ncbi:MAG: glucose-1-phosphate adenylyltransferase [Rhodospirillales bacterium]|nr:glucose-1-phosphate adenylyltransferase [Rhodospirillales bacterium]MDH3910157.1 glucose-1-phosphate adenylyltransferase [Rhodospirillales bacterium]MDH3918781.1 glucose-1-phosphate adenylyltransferase [Rhodospirillales bacterium]